ncbi:MAG: 1-acyl-sn-glycerol-3-phosphate acyltransferase [Bacteroidia bacterium]|jgi:1-acyl-sn-glycerol-3-phosphate acyltransferase|nr:1-acyl-sn-glycerol-3-phosphate acyltransferase [Bacteroidia bacterium]
MSLYTSTQKLLRLGFWFFYRKVHIHQLQNVPVNGPVLLVSNHPNSFMDALVIGAFLPRPTHFLARGDAFKNPVLAKIFKAYHMLPVYRASEGKENIGKNFETFDASYEAVNKGGMVLIFGEGLCKNNWDLRPLKKGPARIAQRAWSSNEHAKKLVIVPVGLTYEHFTGGGKSLLIRYGTPITHLQMQHYLDAPGFVQQLNDRIKNQLEQLAYVDAGLNEDTTDYEKFVARWKASEEKGADVYSELLKSSTESNITSKRWVTRLHYGVIALPHYWLMMLIAKKLTKGSVFYDSILFGLTLFLFPLYWITLLLVLLIIVF